MNREQRRAAGFRGPAYFQAIGDPRPRFMRRHVGEVLAAPTMTRRVRKKRARIIRKLRSY